MTIPAINSNQINNISTKKLLEKFKKGERPRFENNDDKMFGELVALANQYVQSMTVDNKKRLLNHERKMLYDELKHPEYTLARSYESICDVIPKNIKGEEINDILCLFNMSAILREDGLEGDFSVKPIKKEYIDILKDIYTKLNEKNNAGLMAKDNIISLLASYKKNYPDLSEKIKETYKYLYENTQNPDLKVNIKSFNNEFDTESCWQALKNNNDNFIFYLDELMFLSDKKEPKVNKLINKFLKSTEIDNEVMRRAILGAGKFRSDENFEIIKKIALNKNEPDIRKREFAIQSSALYLKEKPEEVKEMMQTISKEDSIFAPLGKILNDKINGNYHSQKDRELKYANINGKKAKDFKHFFKRFYTSEIPLSIKKQNALYCSTIPYINQLKTFSKIKQYLIINHDTITKYMPQYTASRYINKNVGIYNSGAYMDAFDGINSNGIDMMNAYRVGSSDHSNQVAHESGHTLHSIFDKEDAQLIEDLFKKAGEESRHLDYYAAANSHEYFAQGCDAYASYYKPHKLLLTNNPLGHTIYELIDKDPDLFKFIKKVLKKYH